MGNKNLENLKSRSSHIFMEAINYFRDNNHIYIDKSNHPFWKTYQSSPPLPYTLRSLAKLCHFFNRIPEKNKTPFIVDFEHVLMLSGESRNYVAMLKAVPKIERLLLAEECRAIVVPTEGAVRELLKYIKCDEVLQKVNVVRPGCPGEETRRRSSAPRFNLLTIGNKFWGKGIPVAIEVFKKLSSKCPGQIGMTLVCGDIPEGYPLPEGLDVVDVPQLTRELRAKLYQEADLFLFPCLHDSFGVYLEAMAFGVPMISSRIYDKDELVIHGETGYLVDTPLSLYDGRFGVDWRTWDEFQEIAKDLFAADGFSMMIGEMTGLVEALMHDRLLLERMGRAAQKLQCERFSINRRNSLILEVYKKALRHN